MTVSNPRRITVEELYESQRNLPSNELILDVRSAEEFAEGHVPGSRNISYESVLYALDELKEFSTVHLYCHSGARASYAAAMLAQAGVNATVLVPGGMPEWEGAGYPVEQ